MLLLVLSHFVMLVPVIVDNTKGTTDGIAEWLHGISDLSMEREALPY
jgi:hypothetical protein